MSRRERPLARLLARLSSATPSPRRKRTAVTTPRGASGSSCVAVLKRAEGRPVVASCARTMPSSHPNARRDPSGLNAAHCARVDVGQEISHSVAPKSGAAATLGSATSPPKDSASPSPEPRVRPAPSVGARPARSFALREGVRKSKSKPMVSSPSRSESSESSSLCVGAPIAMATGRGEDRANAKRRRRARVRPGAESAREGAQSTPKAARVESSGGTNTKSRPLGATKRTTRGTTRVPPPRGVAGPPVGVTTPSRDRRAGRTRAPRLRVVFASPRPRVVDPSEALTVKSR